MYGSQQVWAIHTPPLELPLKESMAMQTLPDVTVMCTSLIGPEVIECGHAITVHFRITQRKDEGPVPSLLLRNFLKHMCTKVKDGSIKQTVPEVMLTRLIDCERNLVALFRPLIVNKTKLDRARRRQQTADELSSNPRSSFKSQSAWDQSK